MANTENKSVIVPEIYTGVVTEKIKGKVKVAQLATNLGSLVDKEVGETVNFPVWKYIGDAQDIAVGAAMPTTEMKQTNSTATIKMVAANGVKVYDYDNKVALGNAIDEAASQQGESIARKLDTDLITDALGAPMKTKIATKNAITEDELLSALSMFGDDRDTSDFAGIVCYSAFATSFYKMDAFVKTDSTLAKENNGETVNGCIGYFMGIPVILSDRVYDSQNAEGALLLIKKNALGYMPKETPFVEPERVASSRCTNIYTSQIYATKLLDEAGIVVCKTVVAKA